MKKLFFTVILTVAGIMAATAQEAQSRIDSPETAAKENPATILQNTGLTRLQKIDTLSKLNLQYIDSNPLLALEISKEVIGLSEQEGDNKQIISAYARHGRGLVKTGQVAEAKTFFHKALDLTLKEGLSPGKLYYALGAVESYNNPDAALDYDIKALRIFEAENQLPEQGAVLANITALYVFTRDMDKAYEYCLKAIDINQKTGNKSALAHCYLGSMMYIASFKNDTALCIESVKKATELYRELKDSINISAALQSHADLVSDYENDYPKAFALYKEALTMIEPFGQLNEQRGKLLMKLAHCSANLNNFTDALTYHDKAVTMLDSTTFNLEMSEYVKVIIYALMRNPDKTPA